MSVALETPETVKTSASASTPAPIDPTADPFRKAIGSLAFHLHPDRIGTGAVAQLRRMDPGAAVLPPVFWHTLFAHVPEALSGRAKAERAWAVVLNGMAHMAPHMPGPQPDLGEALAATGYSEPRFIRLLRAEGNAFIQEVGTACRWLSAKGESVDWAGFADLIRLRLTDATGAGTGDIALKAQKLTHRIARSYFRTLSKNASADATSTSRKDSAS